MSIIRIWAGVSKSNDRDKNYIRIFEINTYEVRVMTNRSSYLQGREKPQLYIYNPKYLTQMRFVKKELALIFIVLGICQVMCGILPTDINLNYSIASMIPPVDIPNALNAYETNITKTLYILPEEPIYMNETRHRNLFKLYNYTSPSLEMETDYSKLKDMVENAKTISNLTEIDMRDDVYRDSCYRTKKIRSYGFRVIGPVCLNFKDIMLTELRKIDGEQTNQEQKYNALSINRNDISEKLYHESEKSTFIKEQLSSAIESIERIFSAPIEYKEYMNIIINGLNLLNVVNSIRVNGLLDVLHIQKLLQFENEAINMMDYYKEAREILLNKLNQDISERDLAQDIFDCALRYPKVFLPSILDVKYKKIIIYSTCIQIINIIPTCIKQIEALNIESPKVKKQLSRDFFYTYTHAIDTLEYLKAINSYGFNNDELIKIEIQFSRCVKKYLNSARILSNSLNNLKKEIESALSVGVVLERNTPSKMLILNVDYPADKKKIDMINNLIYLLNSEEKICTEQESSIIKLLEKFQTIKLEKNNPPISYIAYAGEVLKNNNLLDNRIKYFRSKLKDL
ncbi:hypothetical protein NEPAR06_0578 [Nematocida parisii]|uniref:uncharacterized protein n=1 Tax=Nematocida parisii (strain ERTm1 / ATCC PRA-289) TaxID=881290 RepID=UPI000264B9AA|nr:uncharacterized protein NEPG_01885 [Nematocida parisii ERTm1]KAI5126281.1 hypothetical protein NEPAR08_0352 [Nematocida parisii]EIJ93543.1 hypothetical protein NEPG_01885 [Nematocida parisii ERTm1]KAI5127148.1 hypothetical protein NEPAR03_0815 [Nematocida parisii]KAI5140134.1 hypothetical protein NEPAR04_0108 [Nematocida parisii]KAI5153584.1 hypothetical protein NEPAR06_0578 [Nematocida parisii]|eukprot:XP_013059713.1 hypothetical protein NEPG_01885 [Nematocida parisii ERTm1]